jgi:hypothetical protein
MFLTKEKAPRKLRLQIFFNAVLPSGNPWRCSIESAMTPGHQKPTNDSSKIPRAPKMALFCHQHIDKMSPFTKMVTK